MTTEAVPISLKAADATWVMLAGRLLLASIFVVSACRKIGDMASVAAYMASNGVPAPGLLLPPATAFELAGGLLLVAGLWARWTAVALLVWTGVLAVIFHPFWAVDAKQYGLQLNLFLFHLETAGGLLYIVAYGAGRFSVDHRRDRR
ncbi:MAG TPA: DoxX family protein [Aliidongia sp.]|nr:DoxX family protein [Aliidongia sp.]